MLNNMSIGTVQDGMFCYCVISGGNRYIPTGSSGEPNCANAADPFTGASRYVPFYGSGVLSGSVTGA
jgi:hypothetical protein